ILGSTAQIALVINCLTAAITLFGLFVVCCGESAQALKIYSGLFILAVIVHFIYAIYFVFVAASNDVLRYYMGTAISQFVGYLFGVCFAKVIVDYTKLVGLEQQNAQTPGRVEASNMTNHQVVN
ncbi:2160_t:CDS:2, partial [Racocetra persica]